MRIGDLIKMTGDEEEMKERAREESEERHKRARIRYREPGEGKATLKPDYLEGD